MTPRKNKRPYQFKFYHNKQKKSELKNTLWAVWTFVVVWQVLAWINPENSFLKIPNLYGDLIFKDDKIQDSLLLAQNSKDSVPVSKKAWTPQKYCLLDSLNKPTLNCIENFDSSLVLSEFQNLFKKAQSEQKLRVAFMGDSYSEGDLISSTLRDSMQSAFGGRGVGLMPLTSKLNHFRHTLEHDFSKDWKVVDFLTQSSSISRGILGQSFIPTSESFSEYWVNPLEKWTSQISQVKLFIQSSQNSAILPYTWWNLQGQKFEIRENLNFTSQKLGYFEFSTPQLKKIHFDFSNLSNSVVYATSFENGNGVYVDNMSLRGHAGNGWKHIPLNQLQEFATHLNFGLIVMQYGLNVAYDPKQTKFKSYEEMMIKTISHLKQAFPKAKILVMSVGDRIQKIDGEMVTPPNIPALVKAQRNIALKSGVMFWNTFEAMGGAGTMKKWTETIPPLPPLGTKDYTHLTLLGGQKMGALLGNALLHLIRLDTLAKADTLPKASVH